MRAKVLPDNGPSTHNLTPFLPSDHDKKRPRCPHCVRGASVRSERFRAQLLVDLHWLLSSGGSPQLNMVDL